MSEPLWKFTDNQGTFVSPAAHKIRTLYFPLCNHGPLMSCVSPDLHGDIKTDFNSFLLQPLSRTGLVNLTSSRNLWMYINSSKIWSATGVSKDISLQSGDTVTLEGGLLWHKIIRQNKKVGLKAEILSFVPSSNEPIELLSFTVTNISRKAVRFTPWAAIPLFARSANNLHDHRHVTSLLSRVKKTDHGVIVHPTLLFDESGHKKNHTSYFVLGMSPSGDGPRHIFACQEEFLGDDSDFERPAAVVKNLAPDPRYPGNGKEPMAGLKFKSLSLKPGQSASYIIILGIVTDENAIEKIRRAFDSGEKIKKSFLATKEFWKEKSGEICVDTHDAAFDNWFRWVMVQPTLRKIFGCSFLPDFDYGKGGRGWRDLWQDCLALLLTHPDEVRPLLLNNFRGVRIDGTNATIIGQNSGEFIADRNSISRVWMDHGIWPLITTHLYVHQSADISVLFEETAYFRDHQLARNKERDSAWSPREGTELKTQSGAPYTGTIIEHILVQNIVQFFNVGPHNHIRLENADWNDGLDMAPAYGESVAFTAFYAHNLNSLCEIIGRTGRDIVVFKELSLLFDSLSAQPLEYENPEEKHRLLKEYFDSVRRGPTGEKIALPAENLIRDLQRKAEWIRRHIQKTEWLKEGFFNGYYNDSRQQVEGKKDGVVRMTLTGQTFPIMSGIATQEQIQSIFKNAKKYLRGSAYKGFRLNTDFKKEQLDLGRAFSFIYGDKENGAYFSHMAVMFAYALYKQGFAKEGFEVFDSLYKMALDTRHSKIYPCLPEYFNAAGRGMYSYLTGSASWFVFTYLTQVWGIRGEYGDLLIEPKLTKEQFKNSAALSITFSFAGKKIEVIYSNPHKKDADAYSIVSVNLNGSAVSPPDMQAARFPIARSQLLALPSETCNTLEVTLD